MHRVEAVRPAHEVCGSFRRTANAAGLDEQLGLHAHLVHGFDDALGDRVVAATRAQRGLPALVIHYGEADAVGLWSGRIRVRLWCGRLSTCPPCWSVRR